MHVSLVIPLYNCLALTQAMLASLQASLPADPSFEYEIIFVDDGSTDGTREWLRLIESPSIRVVLNESNLGYAAANNRGAGLARGEFLLLINNDVLLSPGWLEPMLCLAKSDRTIGIVGNVQLNFKTGLVDHAGIGITAKGKPAHDHAPPHVWEHARRAPACTGACVLIARKLWSKLGGFDEGFLNGGEDVDLCLRARQSGFTTVIATRSVIRHYISASPGRKNRDEANARRLALRWRYELAELGAKAWCREYIARELRSSAAAAQPLQTAKILCYALGWTRRAPSIAKIGMQLAIDRELDRWDRLLG